MRAFLNPHRVVGGLVSCVCIFALSARYPTEVCNANEGYISAAAPGLYDRIFVLGFLEYMCHPAEFIRYLRRFNSTVVLSYTAYYPGVEILGLANTVSREDLQTEVAAAGFRSHVVASVNLPFHEVVDAGINDIPQVIFLLEPESTGTPAAADLRAPANLRGGARGMRVALTTNASRTQNNDSAIALSGSLHSHPPTAASNFHSGVHHVPRLALLRRRLGGDDADVLQPTAVW